MSQLCHFPEKKKILIFVMKYYRDILLYTIPEIAYLQQHECQI